MMQVYKLRQFLYQQMREHFHHDIDHNTYSSPMSQTLAELSCNTSYQILLQTYISLLYQFEYHLVTELHR